MAQYNQRATDGITLNKIMVSITALSITTTMAIGTYEYNKNLDHTEGNIERIETYQKEMNQEIQSISINVNQLVIKQKIDYATQANMNAQINENEKEIKKLKDDMFKLNIYIRRQHERLDN